MRGEKYVIDGVLMSIYQRPAKGNRSAYWIGMYYDSRGVRHEKYLGKEDPRPQSKRVVPQGNGKPHTLRLPPRAWEGLLTIAERTDEYLGEIVPRLIRQEVEKGSRF